MGVNPFRHQLAATSPLRLADLVGAALRGGSETSAVDSLRTRLQDSCDARGVVACGSGTEALFLALQAADWISGGLTRVVLPAFNCFDVASAAVRFGQTLEFYDIDPLTLGPDPESLRSALGHGRQAVVLASLYGLPLDWDALSPVLAQSESIVIEDAAQGHGAAWRGKPLGAHGRLAVRSFGRGKGWTGGAGGALVVRDEPDWNLVGARLEESLRPASSRPGILARAAAHWALGRPAVYGLPRAMPGLGLGETHYRELGPPRAFSETAAVLALRSSGSADDWAAVRRAAGHRYETLLRQSGAGVGLIRVPDAGSPGYLRFPVLTEYGLGSFRSVGKAVRLGAARSYPEILPFLQPVLPLRHPSDHTDAARFKGAMTLRDQLITLPTHPLATESERDRLVGLLEHDSVT